MERLTLVLNQSLECRAYDRTQNRRPGQTSVLECDILPNKPKNTITRLRRTFRALLVRLSFVDGRPKIITNVMRLGFAIFFFAPR